MPIQVQRPNLHWGIARSPEILSLEERGLSEADENQEVCGTAAQSHTASQGEKHPLTLREKLAVVSGQPNQL